MGLVPLLLELDLEAPVRVQHAVYQFGHLRKGTIRKGSDADWLSETVMREGNADRYRFGGAVMGL
jgi:hypothetical protein